MGIVQGMKSEGTTRQDVESAAPNAFVLTHKVLMALDAGKQLVYEFEALRTFIEHNEKPGDVLKALLASMTVACSRFEDELSAAYVESVENDSNSVVQR